MASKRAKGRAGDAANRGNIFSGEKSPQNSQASNGKRAAAGAIEHFETRSKKGRGMARRSLDLIEAMHVAAEAAQPITGRGIGYKLFTAA